MAKREEELCRLNAEYVKLACKGKKIYDIYRILVKQEYYALLSQYEYKLIPTLLRSKRIAAGGSPERTDVSSHKGKIPFLQQLLVVNYL